ncbi:MAG TPA: metal-dependent transcriptional regulator [Candidatus Limnocylindrales bacterium]|nr:metal-dependent transcriptional regulator [Candidatus Limnocylindrales bacterium]
MNDSQPHSRSVEDFVKTVYRLQQSHARVSTNQLSHELQISAPSVTDMARRMVAAGLVDYQKYRGVVLTVEGEALALRILRRHRLIELYLLNELGYSLGEVHREAEHLEHAVSDRFVEAVAGKLGDPHLDPHGEPIPAEDGSIVRRNLRPLTDLPNGVPARVSQYTTDDEAMLEHIVGRGFALGAPVMVMARDPFEGPLTVHIGSDKRIIGAGVAGCILVEEEREVKS